MGMNGWNPVAGAPIVPEYSYYAQRVDDLGHPSVQHKPLAKGEFTQLSLAKDFQEPWCHPRQFAAPHVNKEHYSLQTRDIDGNLPKAKDVLYKVRGTDPNAPLYILPGSSTTGAAAAPFATQFNAPRSPKRPHSAHPVLTTRSDQQALQAAAVSQQPLRPIWTPWAPTDPQHQATAGQQAAAGSLGRTTGSSAHAGAAGQAASSSGPWTGPVPTSCGSVTVQTPQGVIHTDRSLDVSDITAATSLTEQPARLATRSAALDVSDISNRSSARSAHNPSSHDPRFNVKDINTTVYRKPQPHSQPADMLAAHLTHAQQPPPHESLRPQQPLNVASLPLPAASAARAGDAYSQHCEDVPLRAQDDGSVLAPQGLPIHEARRLNMQQPPDVAAAAKGWAAPPSTAGAPPPLPISHSSAPGGAAWQRNDEVEQQAAGGDPLGQSVLRYLANKLASGPMGRSAPGRTTGSLRTSTVQHDLHLHLHHERQAAAAATRAAADRLQQQGVLLEPQVRRLAAACRQLDREGCGRVNQYEFVTAMRAANPAIALLDAHALASGMLDNAGLVRYKDLARTLIGSAANTPRLKSATPAARAPSSRPASAMVQRPSVHPAAAPAVNTGGHSDSGAVSRDGCSHLPVASLQDARECLSASDAPLMQQPGSYSPSHAAGSAGAVQSRPAIMPASMQMHMHVYTPGGGGCGNEPSWPPAPAPTHPLLRPVSAIEAKEGRKLGESALFFPYKADKLWFAGNVAGSPQGVAEAAATYQPSIDPTRSAAATRQPLYDDDGKAIPPGGRPMPGSTAARPVAQAPPWAASLTSLSAKVALASQAVSGVVLSAGSRRPPQHSTAQGAVRPASAPRLSGVRGPATRSSTGVGLGTARLQHQLLAADLAAVRSLL